MEDKKNSTVFKKYLFKNKISKNTVHNTFEGK